MTLFNTFKGQNLTQIVETLLLASVIAIAGVGCRTASPKQIKADHNATADYALRIKKGLVNPRASYWDRLQQYITDNEVTIEALLNKKETYNGLEVVVPGRITAIHVNRSKGEMDWSFYGAVPRYRPPGESEEPDRSLGVTVNRKQRVQVIPSDKPALIINNSLVDALPAPLPETDNEGNTLVPFSLNELNPSDVILNRINQKTSATVPKKMVEDAVESGLEATVEDQVLDNNPPVEESDPMNPDMLGLTTKVEETSPFQATGHDLPLFNKNELRIIDDQSPPSPAHRIIEIADETVITIKNLRQIENLDSFNIKLTPGGTTPYEYKIVTHDGKPDLSNPDISSFMHIFCGAKNQSRGILQNQKQLADFVNAMYNQPRFTDKPEQWFIYYYVIGTFIRDAKFGAYTQDMIIPKILVGMQHTPEGTPDRILFASLLEYGAGTLDGIIDFSEKTQSTILDYSK